MPEMTLRQARELVGITQTRLGQLAGLDHNTIHEVEVGRNRRPAYEVVVRIVRGLHRAGLRGITATDLFPIPDDQPTDESSVGV